MVIIPVNRRSHIREPGVNDEQGKDGEKYTEFEFSESNVSERGR